MMKLVYLLRFYVIHREDKSSLKKSLQRNWYRGREAQKKVKDLMSSVMMFWGI